MELMRNSLQETVERIDSANAGLLVQRGLAVFEKDGEKPMKSKHLRRIAGVNADELYKQALSRWQLSTQRDDFACVFAKVQGRMMMGLSLGGALDTGVISQHSYGMPMIPASSVKGVVRDYFERLYQAYDEQGKPLFHDKKPVLDDKWQAVSDVLFGTDDDSNANAGYVIWHDAWWMADTTKPFVVDVVTVHHQKYYGDEATLSNALDNTENPIPNEQLAVQGGFYFAVQGSDGWADYAKKLLSKALTDSGMGAKGSSGYGYFEIDKRATDNFAEQKIAANKAMQHAQSLQNLSPNQQIIQQFMNGLPDESQWKGDPNKSPNVMIDGKSYNFATLFNMVKDWQEKDDVIFAIDMFKLKLPILLGGPIPKHPKWKERINPLKKKFDIE
ncbi:MAG: type III-B CRISPR module RAMP protein Cmr6 [Moraxella sp.]|nr:type III-B CRISPR module RAMP protein Cmr6 [Moraxella sp.]